MPLEHEDLTGQIIGAAIEVHRELGPGFVEAAYDSGLSIELRQLGIPFTRQQSIPVIYKGERVLRHRLDLFVDDEIVVELKAVKQIRQEHFAVVRSYLRATGRRHGLILNFAKPTLEVKRVIASDQT